MRPERREKQSPCQVECPGGNDVRGWIQVVAQRTRDGVLADQAYAEAWQILAATNPLPACLGRVCPHPCESHCNRSHGDEPVAINAMERFLGDWAIEHELALPLLEPVAKPARVAVVGAGPAGLSFAYQMARRAHHVAVFDRHSEAGGMLRWGIPKYRLPKSVLAAEVGRILSLCTEVRLGVDIGRDVGIESLQATHDIVFLGLGAARGRPLGVPGEAGAGVRSGVDYLEACNRGERPDLGERVVVVGGGDTAIDAARMARRGGAAVTVVYRRTRHEMPAVAEEVEDAISEGIQIEFLVAPLAVRRDADGKVTGLRLQHMKLGEADASGRRRPVPIVDEESDISTNTVIAAVSQAPNWDGLAACEPPDDWLILDGAGNIGGNVWAGGDVAGLGIATHAVFHGRRAAEAAHARWIGEELPEPEPRPVAGPEAVHAGAYPAQERAVNPRRPSAEWLSQPDLEITATLDEGAFREESARCFSCGSCFGCQRCWMYCNPGGYTRLAEVAPGAYYALALDRCEGCGKCIELCPCGFIGTQSPITT